MHKLLIAFIFITQQVTAQNTITSTGSSIKPGDAQLILAHHNSIRKDKGVDELSWSTSLAAYAQKWANYLAQQNNCSIKHRSASGQKDKPYGENIFWGSSANAYPPVEASYSWYSEKKQYKYKKINDHYY